MSKPAPEIFIAAALAVGRVENVAPAFVRTSNKGRANGQRDKEVRSRSCCLRDKSFCGVDGWVATFFAVFDADLDDKRRAMKSGKPL